MATSVFSLFKVGIDPFSSHTAGPIRIAALFTAALRQHQTLSAVRRLEVRLCGSLSTTGVGHGTGRAVIMSLMDEQPDRVDSIQVALCMAALLDSGLLQLDGCVAVLFDWVRDMHLLNENLPYHPNAITLVAYSKQGELHQETYYSVGEGFVANAAQAAPGQFDQDHTVLPYDLPNAEELSLLCKRHNLRIPELMLVNERIWRGETDIRKDLRRIQQAMRDRVDNGLYSEGTPPGGFNVQRRIVRLRRNLQEIDKSNVVDLTLSAMEWVGLFALAVNEENAAGGRMVTVLINSTMGVTPVALRYRMRFNPDTQGRDAVDYLLAIVAVDILCRRGASISSAEVGCQGEVGSARTVAIADLTGVLDAALVQAENAAEIGLEHNLGPTYNPVGGLAQVPCIEHSVIAAVRATNAAQMALRGGGQHFVSLDRMICTMRDTGADVHDKYKETLCEGLAVSAIEC